ncbi:hypothetical protein DSO57_1002623 [Entomophthora muscae]|uniref:Uncharacterized protein n=1 Tax=Entomophthora muscae TaxID=34485 RepID=A0ACC2SXX9_9FUNG|nr:hypothetical protein DSO57_1002623 [Entomophthora muscae]
MDDDILQEVSVPSLGVSSSVGSSHPPEIRPRQWYGAAIKILRDLSYLPSTTCFSL